MRATIQMKLDDTACLESTNWSQEWERKDYSRFPSMRFKAINPGNTHQSFEVTLSQSSCRSGVRNDDWAQLIRIARQDNTGLLVREKYDRNQQEWFLRLPSSVY